MKKAGLILVVSLVSINLFAQEKDESKLTIFKFNPLQLITSSLSFGTETFNKSRTRSDNFTLGIRYKSDDVNFNNNISQSGEIIENYSNWKGVTAQYERRFYVPKFKEGKPNFINTESSQNGVYLAPSLRFDYVNRDFSNGYFESKFDNLGSVISETRIFTAGKVDYFGIIPAVNLGIQFSVFQYGYIDLHVGGGVKLIHENDRSLSSTSNYRYSDYNNITEIVFQAGVRPTGGISFGVKL